MFEVVITMVIAFLMIRIIVFESVGYLFYKNILADVNTRLDTFKKVRTSDNYSFWESPNTTYSIMVNNSNSEISIHEQMDSSGKSRCVLTDAIKSSWIVSYMYFRPIEKYVLKQ